MAAKRGGVSARIGCGRDFERFCAGFAHKYLKYNIFAKSRKKLDNIFNKISFISTFECLESDKVNIGYE